MKRLLILVDVQNVYYTTREVFRQHFDYNLFWKQVTDGRKLVKAIAYAIDRGDPKQRQFQGILRGIGFETKLKPYIKRSDGSSKGDWDVGITLDALEHADHVDVVVLASGDGDFDLLVQKLRGKYGVEVEVFGVEKLSSNSLISSATRFFPINPSLLLKKS